MKRIGEILIEHGTLAQDQLDLALKRQKESPGKLLGAVLIELGYVTEEDIVVALATQFNVPYLPVANFTMDEEIQNTIPKELIQKYICVPLDRIGNLLTVVMADPTNERAVAEIEKATGCKVQVFVTTVTEITSVIQERYKIADLSGALPNENVSHISFRSAVKHKTDQKPSKKS